MSSSDLRDRMDGLQWECPVAKLETIMPGSSFLTYSRGENVKFVISLYSPCILSAVTDVFRVY